MVHFKALEKYIIPYPRCIEALANSNVDFYWQPSHLFHNGCFHKNLPSPTILPNLRCRAHLSLGPLDLVWPCSLILHILHNCIDCIVLSSSKILGPEFTWILYRRSRFLPLERIRQYGIRHTSPLSSISHGLEITNIHSTKAHSDRNIPSGGFVSLHSMLKP